AMHTSICTVNEGTTVRPVRKAFAYGRVTQRDPGRDLLAPRSARGTPIEPKTFSAHWHDGLRACGIRQRGLYTTKDTYVTTALSDAGVQPAWIDQQTGVAYTTLRNHYGKILPSHVTSQLERFATVAPTCFTPGHVAKVLPKIETWEHLWKKEPTKS